ncbi:nucleotidyltransferase family protein [Dyella kyungheensis]|uniref:Nucleotidyltransferase family protein n=1 Tax=Dyella kyungheensis TaxID=1242174 RepID=A0ABS2JU36_9GAMM|nr:nucleotidyltransferase family protein [Dyella kyungheensis]MBM7122104.1 nucleotidyltransferase family protein [Dyella kyungheensis]
MSRHDLQIGAIILAAGSASRYGALKQVIAIDGEPMVRRIARNALAARLQPVIVVVGAQGDRVIDCLNNLDVVAVENVEWASGMGSSLSEGVKALMAQASTLQALMVLLADQPAIRLDDLENMLTAHAQAPQRILACGHEGALSPPCIFPMTYAEELSALQGPQGARSLLEKHAAQVDAFDLPAALADIDEPDDYTAWETAQNRSRADEI